MGSEDQNNAREIANGVGAWKKLTEGKGRAWRKFNRKKSVDRQRRDSANEGMVEDGGTSSQETAGGDEDDPNNRRCPFAELSHLGELEEHRDATATGVNATSDPPAVHRDTHADRAKSFNGIGGNQRPDSLPTPPDAQEHFRAGPAREDTRRRHISPPPSASGSISKCPIRMLDERSPEEVAQFFEDHKHEIPRSHEVCVRRYQRNAQSIRQLDAKYGDLANMIQGLGMKHQPLLPSKEEAEGNYEEDEEDEDETAMDSKSIRKVEHWANNVNSGSDGGNNNNPTGSPNYLETEDKRGNFDRSFKEIRVGESPSRPWGISVPGPPLAFDRNENEGTSALRGAESKAARVQPEQGRKLSTGQETKWQKEGNPQMIFTGPVFIGYGPEQAAAYVKACEFDT